MTEQSSLEGWLAVKENAFREVSATKPKAKFYARWNPIERKFCVTLSEKIRSKTDTLPTSRSGLYSVAEINAIVNALCDLCPDVAELSPSLPANSGTEPSTSWSSRLWSYVGYAEVNETEEGFDRSGDEIVRFLSAAYDKCTYMTMLSVMFDSDFDFDTYYENLSELKHKSYLERLQCTQDHFEFLVRSWKDQRLTSASIKRRNRQKAYTTGVLPLQSIVPTTTMIITADSTARFLYDLELAVDKHLEVVAEYYSYLRQPFLDLRELSLDQLNSVKRLIDSGLFGNRVVAEHQAKVPLLQQEYGDSLDNIIELQLLYYKDTCKVFKKYFDVLKCEMDLCHIVDMKPLIGQQMRSVDEKLCTESISYWNSTILSLKNQQVKLVNKISALNSASSSWQSQLKLLEEELYCIHKQLLAAKLDLLKEKCKYFKLKLQMVAGTVENNNCDETTMNGEEEFFDAPQTAEDLESLLITTSTYFDSNDNFLKSFEYKTTLQSLFKQISSCRIQQKKLDEQFKNGHLLKSVAIREDNARLQEVLSLKEIADKQNGEQRMKKEREMTLNRLRDYKSKRPSLAETTREKSPLSQVPTDVEPKSFLRKGCGKLATTTTPTKTKTDEISERKSPPKINMTKSPAVPPLRLPAKSIASDNNVEMTDVTISQPIKIPPPPPPPPPCPPPIFMPPPPPPPPPPPLMSKISSEGVGGATIFNVKLKKAEPSIFTSLTDNPMDSVLASIKSGVKLRQVPQIDINSEEIRYSSLDPNVKMLQEALARIKKVTQDSDSEDEENEGNRSDYNFDSD